MLANPVTVWSLRPDWSAGVTERLSWLTDVLPHYNGTEQRVRLRDNARRNIELGFLLLGQEAQLLESLVFGDGARPVALPVWWQADWLRADVPSGALSVTVSEAAFKDYRVGGWVVFWQDAFSAELAEIRSIAGDVLSFTLPLAQGFTAGARVMPALAAFVDGEVALNYLTDRCVTGRMRFAVDGAVDKLAAEIGPLWQGFAVLDVPPDWSAEVTEHWGRQMAVLDFLTGVVTRDDLSGAPVLRRSLGWLLVGRAEIDRWQRWAAARAGRWSAFWLPSFKQDVLLLDPLTPTDTTLRVRTTRSAQSVGVHPLRAGLRLELFDGTVLMRRVLAVSALDATAELVTLDSAVGVAVLPEQVRRLMWLSRARLDMDALEFFYETDAHARLNLTFRGVL